MEIVKFLQQLSNPVLDLFMRIITQFGDIYFYLAIGIVFYWIIDKKFGFKLLVAFLFSMTINGLIKSIVKRPRPFHEDPSLLMSNFDATDGFSFPSGHSQGIFSMGTLLIKERGSIKWLKYSLIFLMIFVPISRVYLAQHYLSDVLVGAVIGILFSLLGLFLLEYGSENKEDIRALYLIPIVFILAIVFDDKDIFRAAGAYTGLTLGYFLEKKYVGYNIKDTLKVNALKLLIGVPTVFGLEFGFKAVLRALSLSDSIVYIITYFFVTMWASFGVMALFKVIFKKEEDLVLKES